jgi:hypothetical protein
MARSWRIVRLKGIRNPVIPSQASAGTNNVLLFVYQISLDYFLVPALICLVAAAGCMPVTCAVVYSVPCRIGF